MSTEESAGGIEIRVITIVELVEKNPNIDYVSLDIEGGELEIMKAFPWSICKPTVFTIEYNNNLLIKDKLKKLMTIQGYSRILDSITNFES